MQKEPFGPLDVHTELDRIKKLIGKNILYANHKEGLGSYGVLISIHPELSYPYKIKSDTPPYTRTFHARWIVEHV